MSEQARAVIITQRLARKTDFTAADSTKCAFPVPYYGGGGGSRYYGPSYSQCNRPPVWRVVNAEGVHEPTGYCAQHARKLKLLVGGEPIEGVERRSY